MIRVFQYQWHPHSRPNLEIEPVDQQLFYPLVYYLCWYYQLPPPTIHETLDGYIADLIIEQRLVMIQLDTWSFGLLCHDQAQCDQLREVLSHLPEDWLSHYRPAS